MEDSREVMKENICVFTAVLQAAKNRAVELLLFRQQVYIFSLCATHDITCLEINWQALEPCQSTVS